MHPLHRKRPPLHLLLALAAALLLSLPVLASAECYDCHGGDDILTMTAGDAGLKDAGPAKTPRVFPPFPGLTRKVDKAKFDASVHKGLSCTDCHADAKGDEHNARLAPVKCDGCHAKEAAVFAKSRHVILHDPKDNAAAPRCVDCHGAHDIVPVKDSASPVYSANIPKTCNRCHGSDAAVNTAIPIPGAGKMYMQSTHYKKLADGGANCKDCHAPSDPHDLKDRTDPASPIFKANIASTCGNCHDGAVSPWRESVHGQAFLRGTPDAPTCTNCHGEHLNVPKGDPAITTQCATCHGSEKLARMYGFKGFKVAGYEQSFHGLAAKLGDRRVANCASCHGNHAVFPASDPRSSVHETNLAKTCGQTSCHPGVKDFAAMGNIHVDNEGEGALIKKIVKNVYIYLIILGTLGGMFAHNALDFYRKMKIRYEKRKKEQLYERLNRTERFQHLVTLTTFITLVITGFSLKWNFNLFPWLDDARGALWRGWIHRGAAVAMIYGSLDHLRYILTTARGKDQFLRMLPTPKDAKDILHNIKFFLGIVDHPPRFARWTYIEKMEYLALLWGTVVMIATGFLLWFPTQALKHIPMWGIDVATLIHYYEAILATGAIIIWHWYTVFLNPDFAPMSFTWIDGNLTRAEMAHEHPLDLEEIEGKPLGDDHGHH